MSIKVLRAIIGSDNIVVCFNKLIIIAVYENSKQHKYGLPSKYVRQYLAQVLQ